MSKRSQKITAIIPALIPIIISALGGALVVYSSYDDSPGGTLTGLVLIAVSAYLIIKKPKK